MGRVVQVQAPHPAHRKDARESIVGEGRRILIVVEIGGRGAVQLDADGAHEEGLDGEDDGATEEAPRGGGGASSQFFFRACRFLPPLRFGTTGGKGGGGSRLRTVLGLGPSLGRDFRRGIGGGDGLVLLLIILSVIFAVLLLLLLLLLLLRLEQRLRPLPHRPGVLEEVVHDASDERRRALLLGEGAEEHARPGEDVHPQGVPPSPPEFPPTAAAAAAEARYAPGVAPKRAQEEQRHEQFPPARHVRYRLGVDGVHPEHRSRPERG
mmetsp:Transcript_33417/g.99500  ORF Transcript_33417/g.99500 Transcript_33417/m.99500 type:complete len:266 (-) Transcript_33417:78-875(-)